ncbi:hypothetical protein BX661DRAFT_185611, partial [Kickxella alabastrina]|uniref:uncharacterized protein n=1 Tax=Kickxella alabastrina TaxID=61397 RepID=UPI00221FB1A8
MSIRMLRSICTRRQGIGSYTAACRLNSMLAVPQNSKMSWMLLPTKKPTKKRYIHQSSAGIYTLMPMAQRVIDKIEGIIDDEMQAIGGQKLAMPNLLSPENWIKTGRWESTGDELFSFKDRKQSTLILGPTHEEEVTAIVKEMVRSFRQYPLRLYQTTRKFRDEARPRAGLLRGREFIMKDMYSFDATREQAIETFYTVERAYRRCFGRIGVPYVVADADSGNIGGSLSKEFHFVNPSGEDTLLACQSCGYMANEERARSRCTGHSAFLATMVEGEKTRLGQRLVVVPADHEPSALKIKQAWPTQSSQRIEFTRLLANSSTGCTDAATGQLAPLLASALGSGSGSESEVVTGDWHVAQAGDSCAECVGGTLSAQRAIEVGHIFYLGDKYSRAMDLNVLHQGERSHVEMGAAECSSSGANGGLMWPMNIAPFLAAIVSLTGQDHVPQVYQLLSDVTVKGQSVFKDNIAVDDRDYLSAGFRLNDAQLLGFPITVVLGRAFASSSEVEVQLRIPGMKLEATSIAGIEIKCDGHECRALFLTAALEKASSSAVAPGQTDDPLVG